MLSNNLFIWIKFIKNGKSHFRLPLSIPIWVLSEILESFILVTGLIDLFIPKQSNDTQLKQDDKLNDPYYSKEINQTIVVYKKFCAILDLIENLFIEIVHYHGIDLVDVKTPEVEVKIKIV